MDTITYDDARADLSRIKQGDRIAVVDVAGKAQIGTVKIKEIRCGKAGCSKCPHKTYAYAQWRDGAKVKEKYIGKVQ